MKKIALYGGTFNPPHITHAAVVETLLRSRFFDEIWIMPSGERTDKKANIGKSHRLNMLKIMINDFFPHPKIPIQIIRLEIDKSSLTYTHETLEELKSLHPDKDFKYIIGADILGDIKSKWIKGEEIFNSIHFIVIPHGGAKIPSSLPENVAVLNDVAETSLSSTFIRKIISEGATGLPYVSPETAKYIQKKGLYQ